MTEHKDAMTPGQAKVDTGADVIAAIVQQARGDLCWIPDCTALDALRKCVDISETFAALSTELTALRAERERLNAGWLEANTTALSNALERDDALARVGVLEVEPLVWVESEKSSEYLTADTGFGIIYRISAHRGPDNVMWWLGNTAKGENLADIPAAKAAAQEDYKARKLAKIGGAL